jgi:hypothetical protein
MHDVWVGVRRSSIAIPTGRKRHDEALRARCDSKSHLGPNRETFAVEPFAPSIPFSRSYEADLMRSVARNGVASRAHLNVAGTFYVFPGFAALDTSCFLVGYHAL